MEEIIEYLERLEVKETGWLGKGRLEMREEEILNEVLLELSKRKMYRGRRKMLQAVEKEQGSSEKESIKCNKSPLQSTCERWPSTETIWIGPRQTPGENDKEQSESSDEEETVSKEWPRNPQYYTLGGHRGGRSGVPMKKTCNVPIKNEKKT